MVPAGYALPAGALVRGGEGGPWRAAQGRRWACVVGGVYWWCGFADCACVARAGGCSGPRGGFVFGWVRFGGADFLVALSGACLGRPEAMWVGAKVR